VSIGHPAAPRSTAARRDLWRHRRRVAVRVTAGSRPQRCPGGARSTLGRFVGAAVLGLVLVTGGVAAQAAESPAPRRGPLVARFHVPVPGPIFDGWRPPATPYGAGNRGIDLWAAPGEAVVAVADGRVTFAGQVGGRWFVVTEHPHPSQVSGATGTATVRITLGFVAAVHVATGAMVRVGQLVATAAGPVHVGLRRGEAYLDPRPLFATVRVRLVD
jgi:murein DD-endopeptidase MepM/ murein hydrolase activator NlpD